jgi:hypothetical protein
MQRWKTDEPLVRDPEHGIPILFPALAVNLHMGPLTPEHVPALEAANAMILEWIGERLHFTYSSSFPFVERFRQEDLDYTTGFLRLLDPRLDGVPDVLRDAQCNLRASLVDDTSLDCHAGEQEVWSSPYQYRFTGCIGDDDEVERFLPSRVMLRFTLPATWPLDDFRDKALAVARALPIRWGNAGLGYAGWELNWYQDVEAGIFAHARRYPGFDVGYEATLMNDLHRAMRTVSWLNFVGPGLREKLEEAGREVASTDLCKAWDDGPNLVLQAGAEPEAGDINRLDVPRAYVQADAMLRPIRLAPTPDTSFYDQWDEKTTAAWIERFERRTS